MTHEANEAELNEKAMSSSYQGSLKCRRLKKSMKDKCLVIGETTMYYGNFQSVQVLSPIPGSPNLDSAAESMNIRPGSPKEVALPIQPKQQATSKNPKGKKSTSQKKTSAPKDEKKTSAPKDEKKTSAPKDEKSTSPNYQLPPLKAAPAANNIRCPSRSSRGREPCNFLPSIHIERRGNGLMSTDQWIPQPDFKPREKKTMPRRTITSTSSNSKHGSLDPIKGVQASSSLVAAPVDSVRLPAIRGATRAPESPRTTSPTAQYTNTYKDSDKLPPMKVRSVTIADKELDREYYKLTKAYRR